MSHSTMSVANSHNQYRYQHNDYRNYRLPPLRSPHSFHSLHHPQQRQPSPPSQHPQSAYYPPRPQPPSSQFHRRSRTPPPRPAGEANLSLSDEEMLSTPHARTHAHNGVDADDQDDEIDDDVDDDVDMDDDDGWSEGSLCSNPNSNSKPHPTSNATSASAGNPDSKSHSHSHSHSCSRRLLSLEQSKVLYRILEKTHFPSTRTRETVASQLGVSPRKVQVWFQNRRQVGKKRMIEAILSSPPSLQQSAAKPSLELLAVQMKATGKGRFGANEDDRTRAWRKHIVRLALNPGAAEGEDVVGKGKYADFPAVQRMQRDLRIAIPQRQSPALLQPLTVVTSQKENFSLPPFGYYHPHHHHHQSASARGRSQTLRLTPTPTAESSSSRFAPYPYPYAVSPRPPPTSTLVSTPTPLPNPRLGMQPPATASAGGRGRAFSTPHYPHYPHYPQTPTKAMERWDRSLIHHHSNRKLNEHREEKDKEAEKEHGKREESEKRLSPMDVRSLTTSNITNTCPAPGRGAAWSASSV